METRQLDDVRSVISFFDIVHRKCAIILLVRSCAVRSEEDALIQASHRTADQHPLITKLENKCNVHVGVARNSAKLLSNDNCHFIVVRHLVCVCVCVSEWHAINHRQKQQQQPPPLDSTPHPPSGRTHNASDKINAVEEKCTFVALILLTNGTSTETHNVECRN